MRQLKSKQCLNCRQVYIPTGSCSKFCSISCRDEYNKEHNYEVLQAWRRKQGVQVGVGKGGATGFGKANPYYKNGIGIFHRQAPIIKQQRRYCEFCGKDLLDVTRYEWCLHHRDHDRTNNDPSNWILLCKSCHQIEHKCWKAFERATTREKSRSSQEGSETPSP